MRTIIALFSEVLLKFMRLKSEVKIGADSAVVVARIKFTDSQCLTNVE